MTHILDKVWTSQDYIDLYPEGRTFYDESDVAQNPEAEHARFLAVCLDLGLVVDKHFAPPSSELEPWITVYVPAVKLFDFYAEDLIVGT